MSPMFCNSELKIETLSLNSEAGKKEQKDKKKRRLLKFVFLLLEFVNY